MEDLRLHSQSCMSVQATPLSCRDSELSTSAPPSIQSANTINSYHDTLVSSWNLTARSVAGTVDSNSRRTAATSAPAIRVEKAATHPKREQFRMGYEARRRKEAGTIERSLMRASAIAGKVWALCYFTYPGYSACHFPLVYLIRRWLR